MLIAHVMAMGKEHLDNMLNDFVYCLLGTILLNQGTIRGHAGVFKHIDCHNKYGCGLMKEYGFC